MSTKRNHTISFCFLRRWGGPTDEFPSGQCGWYDSMARESGVQGKAPHTESRTCEHAEQLNVMTIEGGDYVAVMCAKSILCDIFSRISVFVVYFLFCSNFGHRIM